MSSPQRGRARVDRTTVVLVVERGGDVWVFPTADRAAARVEPHDVEQGEYAGAYGLDGTVYALSTAGDEVVLRAGQTRDPAALTRALEQSNRHTPGGVPLDPLALADGELQFQWEHRWPRWPAWLDRRVNGERPPRLAGPQEQP